jgi:hypothetical protein
MAAKRAGLREHGGRNRKDKEDTKQIPSSTTKMKKA